MLDVEVAGSKSKPPHLSSSCMSLRAASGRSLPVVATAYTGQVECKQLVSTSAIDLSVAMEISSQVHVTSQLEPGNPTATSRNRNSRIETPLDLIRVSC